jgi:hypothetical protein
MGDFIDGNKMNGRLHPSTEIKLQYMKHKDANAAVYVIGFN